MNILELDSYNLGDAVKFNNKLNPNIWAGETMRPEVREKLLAIAEDFKEFLGLSDIEVKDITVSGSNANYSYTPYSDIDLHLVVDIPRADSDEVYRELFDAKKYQYNDLHNFKIGKYDVELYVENANKPPVSKGVYSVLNDDWINIPRKIRSEVDDDAVRSKYEDLKHRIDNAITSNESVAIDLLAKKIKNMRQAGLDTHGELGPENLAYKMLRSQGKIKQLYDARNRAKDQELSLKEKAPATHVTYGFKTPTVAEDVGMSWDGVSPSTKMFLSETDSDEAVLKDFIDFCVKELKIETMPIIKLRRDPQWSVINRTFGRYTNDKHMLEVAFGQRHIMDVLRTVAHELTHKHQHERDGKRMGPDAGETGSPWENEANARAGVLMRDYGRLHPELFDTNGLDESASGYIPTKKQAKDPRWSMALTQDIKPGQLGKEANKLKLKTDSQGHPQVANPNGLFEKLSLELSKFKQADEDYSPDNPPGPETKPTMPKGTVRVDVSDMYDWYKLGKNISNLKAVDKSQFGKGPPSTIVSFGDEETEHKYINDLENLGLSTTDIDPVDPNQPKGMKRQKTDPTYNVAESQQLDEVRMAPSNLMQWAKSPEAEGVRAGFEAELIFRDTNSGDDSDQDMEPDYDQDERCRSIQQVIDFFQNGDYGGMSPRQERALQEGLDEQYFEWQDEEMYKSWRDERDDLIKEAWLREKPMSERVHAYLVDGLDLSDEEADRIQAVGDAAPKFNSTKEQQAYAEENPDYATYLEAAEGADDILQEDVEQTIEKEDGFYDEVLDDFRGDFYVDDNSGFFDDAGLRYMSDVANSYDLDWPYLMGSGSNGGSRDWDSIGDSLHDTIDMPVKVSSGYHSATRKEGLWIVEPDSSLEPDDQEDFGLEIVSPPLPLLTTLEKLQDVCDWANDPSEGNAYTNSSTGLHMGVSVPFKGGDVDYLKLVLFMGDEYVLKSFGREANTYTKSAMSKFKENIKGGRTDPMSVIKLMQHGLLELAQREVQKGVGEGKYTSVHVQKGYIEFRSAGGDWLAEESADPEKLQSTMIRYAYAMSLAANPNAERREYAKKLYKLVAPEGDSELALFSQFAAGELTAEQLKKKWAEKTIGTEKKMNQRWKLYQMVDGVWTSVPGAEWNGYTEDQVKNAVWSKYGREALDTGEYQLVNMGEQSWEVYDVKTGKTLEIVKGKSKGEVADTVYDKYVDQGIGFQVRPYEDPATMTPRAKLAKQIAQAPAEQPAVYQVVNRKTGEVYDTVEGTKSGLGGVLRNFEKSQNIPQGDAVLKLAPNQPAQSVDDYRGKWEFFYAPTGRVLDAVDDASIMQARAVLADTQRRYDDLQSDQIQMRKAGAEQEPAVAQNFNQPQDATEIPRNWEFVDRITGRVVDTLAYADYNQANTWQAAIERSNPNMDIYLRSVSNLEENFADIVEYSAFDLHHELFEHISQLDVNLFENRESYSKLKNILEKFSTDEPTVGQDYVYTSVAATPAGKFISVAQFDQPHELVDIKNGRYYFLINNQIRAFPEQGGIDQTDSYQHIFMFDNTTQRDKLIGWITLNHSPDNGWKISHKKLSENFADGKGPGRPGDSQRHGIPKGVTIAELEKAAKAPGRKGQLARWQLNMRRGKKK